MRVASTLLMLGLLACTKAGSTSEPISNPPPGAKLPPAPIGPAPVVQITSVTLGENCGVAAAAQGSAIQPSEEERKRAPRGESEADSSGKSSGCDPTTMALSVTGAPSGAPQTIRIKKVELFDDKGTLIGELTWRGPTLWAKDGYFSAWDQTVATSQELSVTYNLSSPNWSKVPDRWNRSFTLKVALTASTANGSAQHESHIEAPASIPAAVET